MSSSSSSGGTGLLAVLAAATVFIVILEGALLAAPTAWMAGTVFAVLIVVALTVVSAVVRVIDHGSVVARPPQSATAKRELVAPDREPTARPAHRAVLGH